MDTEVGPAHSSCGGNRNNKNKQVIRAITIIVCQGKGEKARSKWGASLEYHAEINIIAQPENRCLMELRGKISRWPMGT